MTVNLLLFILQHNRVHKAKVKEGVQLYLYFPFGPSWYVLGWTSPFTLYISLNIRLKRCFTTTVKQNIVMGSARKSGIPKYKFWNHIARRIPNIPRNIQL
jgi:hypothetical protein